MNFVKRIRGFSLFIVCALCGILGPSVCAGDLKNLIDASIADVWWNSKEAKASVAPSPLRIWKAVKSESRCQSVAVESNFLFAATKVESALIFDYYITRDAGSALGTCLVVLTQDDKVAVCEWAAGKYSFQGNVWPKRQWRRVEAIAALPGVLDRLSRQNDRVVVPQITGTSWEKRISLIRAHTLKDGVIQECVLGRERETVNGATDDGAKADLIDAILALPMYARPETKMLEDLAEPLK